MNKVRLFVYTFALIALLIPGPAKADVLDDPSLIRLHIIAHSDSFEDQNIKLAVRDAVRAQFAEIARSVGSADEAYAAAGDAAVALEEIAEATLAQGGFDYGACVELGEFDFPDKAYDGTLVPAGTYRAVRVVLGAGEGRNWWCVLYPDLCFVDAACRREAMEDKPITFYSSIGRWLDRTINRGDEQ